MINSVIKENPEGKRPIGRSRLRWGDCVKREVKSVDPEANYREVAEDKIRWREICYTGWSSRQEKPEKKIINTDKNLIHNIFLYITII
jgi:hypothetical protein